MSKLKITKGRRIRTGDLIILNPTGETIELNGKIARLNRMTGDWITGDGRIATTRKQAIKLLQ